MKETFFYPGAMVWHELREFPGKGEVTVLRDEGKGRPKTMIVRLPAGGQILPHSHVAPVQHYVLEGECETQGKTLGKGAYRFLPERADVSTIFTRDGVTILMIYDIACE
ncbi:MAG TPA: cupin domain-containing protein [Spirochaetia bacterium]|nr:cupin domain-containing protein [Spirochaetia bacterium]